MCTGATVANLKHTHKSTSACCFRLAKIHAHLREIEWNRSWSFTNRTHTVRSGKGQKEFKSKSFRITVIYCDQHVSSFFTNSLTPLCHTNHTGCHPHPSPISSFPLCALVGAGELVSLFAAEPELERGHGTSKRNFFTSQIWRVDSCQGRLGKLTTM